MTLIQTPKKYKTNRNVVSIDIYSSEYQDFFFKKKKKKKNTYYLYSSIKYIVLRMSTMFIHRNGNGADLGQVIPIPFPYPII